ncbi:MAG TPA: hypothetical protein VGF87_05120 [Acidimicrobiales bacterium]|jgi:hypothetical protein
MARQSIWADFRDAIVPRTTLLVVGVLLLQFAFLVSFIGALHQPTPRQVPVELVANKFIAVQVVGKLNHLSGTPIRVTTQPSADTARNDLRDGTTDGALVVNIAGKSDTLLVASGAGAAVTEAVETVFDTVEAYQHRTLHIVDVVPTGHGDTGGLSGYYLVTGWIVGGYLMAALLGVAKGARPTTVRRAAVRLIATIPYAIVSGLAGALIAGPILGALSGHLATLAVLGTLLVLAAAAVTIALQTLLGVVGIGVTILLFVILGNPSAGGAYQWPLLPSFWRDIGPALPNGAGTEAVRKVVYFGAQHVLPDVLVIALYVVGGVVVSLVAASFVQRRTGATTSERRLISLGRDGYAPATSEEL